MLRMLTRSVPGAATGLLVLASAAPIWAQEAEAASADKSSWAMGYALTSLAIVLGLVVICRPGYRSSEVKIEE
jgi:hypothetical protein